MPNFFGFTTADCDDVVLSLSDEGKTLYLIVDGDDIKLTAKDAEILANNLKAFASRLK